MKPTSISSSTSSAKKVKQQQQFESISEENYDIDLSSRRVKPGSVMSPTNSTKSLKTEPSALRVYNCYSDVYRLQNYDIRNPFEDANAAAFHIKQEQMGGRTSAANGASQETEGGVSPTFQQLQQDQPSQKTTNQSNVNHAESDNIYVEYCLAQQKANGNVQTSSAGQQQRSSFLAPQSSVSDVADHSYNQSNGTTPKSSITQQQSSASKKKTIQGNSKKPWGSSAAAAATTTAAGPRGGINGGPVTSSNRVSSRKPSASDKDMQYPPRELSQYSSEIAGGASVTAVPKHIYLSIGGGATGTPQDSVEQSAKKTASLQGSAQKANVIDALMTAKKSLIDIRDKEQKKKQNLVVVGNANNGADQAQTIKYKPTFISESNIYLMDARVLQQQQEQIVQQQQEEQSKQKQQQYQHAHTSMPQSPSSGYVKKALGMSSQTLFPSRDSLVNSAKERQNYEFIAVPSNRTLIIRSKEASFTTNGLMQSQQQVTGQFASQYGSGGPSVYGSNREMMQSLVYKAVPKSPERYSPKTQLSEAHFYAKEKKERGEIWMSHKQLHQGQLNEHYAAEEMRECSFAPTFFTKKGGSMKGAVVQHVNRQDRVEQSLNPLFHRAAQRVKESYASLYHFKKETGYIVEQQEQQRQEQVQEPI